MVDAADTVVRMNDCKNSVGRSGRKTSILCINNCGAPARRYVDGAILRKIPICVEAREIWIPRESEVHRKHAARHQESAMLRESDDLTSAILKANGLADRVVVRLTAALNEQMFEAIQQARRRHAIADPAWMPSTGLLTVAGVLSDPRFSAYHVHLVGYRFQGWAGHPWRAERTILAEQERNGRLTIHRF